MSEKQTAAEKAATAIQEYAAYELLGYRNRIQEFVTTAIDAETARYKPLVEALRAARAFIWCAKDVMPQRGRDPHFPRRVDAEDELARIDVALAEFEKEGGGK